jgi:hypothetical protein
MQILTSRFSRRPFDQDGLTKDCNLVGKAIRDNAHCQEETLEKNIKKRTVKEKSKNTSNQPPKIEMYILVHRDML